MSDKPRMLCVARDADGEVWLHPSMETYHIEEGQWRSEGRATQLWDNDAIPDLKCGECRMFIEFAPRVATEDGATETLVWWNGDRWAKTLPAKGDIILPMPPDPTPYLTQADPYAERRAEIDAQIAALQAERNRLEA